MLPSLWLLCLPAFSRVRFDKCCPAYSGKYDTLCHSPSSNFFVIYSHCRLQSGTYLLPLIHLFHPRTYLLTDHFNHKSIAQALSPIIQHLLPNQIFTILNSQQHGTYQQSRMDYRREGLPP